MFNLKDFVVVKGSGLDRGGFKTIIIGDEEYSAQFIAELVAAHKLATSFKKIKK